LFFVDIGGIVDYSDSVTFLGFDFILAA